MEYIWPYWSNKKKAFFKQGNKKMKLTLKRKGGKTKVFREGDRINNIFWNVGFTINLEEVEFVE